MNPVPGTSEQFWSDAWTRHLETYLTATPRTGLWLERHFPQRPRTLEIAGGSCRDSRHLAARGWDATGSDFEAKTLAYLRRRFGPACHPLLHLDAFSTGLPDGAFELTFHNGFFVLFDDDARLHALLREQARISQHTLVIIVHNALNTALEQRFANLARTDPLYGIRFFTPADIGRIVRESGISARSIEVHKFGGRLDALYRPHLKGLPNPLRRVAPGIVPHLYQLQGWTATERVAVIVRL